MFLLSYGVLSWPNGYVDTMGAYYEYRSTKEGNRMLELLEHLNDMAIEFCEWFHP